MAQLLDGLDVVYAADEAAESSDDNPNDSDDSDASLGSDGVADASLSSLRERCQTKSIWTIDLAHLLAGFGAEVHFSTVNGALSILLVAIVVVLVGSWM